MPPDNILYYPSINLPKSPWVTKSILYWEKVSTIVPYEFIQNPDLLQKEMRDLVLAGAVIQEPTSDYNSEQFNASREVLKMLLQIKDTIPELRSNFEKGHYWKIHREKFYEDLFDNLVSWGLAKKISNWYLIEESVAKIMMTTLATLIGAKTKSLLSTDEIKYIPEGNIFLPETAEKEHFRELLLDGVMPYPEHFDLDQLVNFKEKYHAELKDFRRIIERSVLQVRSINNKEVQKEMLQSQIDEIIDRRDELTERLKENKFTKITLGSVKGALIDGAISLVTGDPITPATTILKAIVDIRKEYLERPFRDEDLSYIALLKYKNG